jgi:hypothetical protein
VRNKGRCGIGDGLGAGVEAEAASEKGVGVSAEAPGAAEGRDFFLGGGFVRGVCAFANFPGALLVDLYTHLPSSTCFFVLFGQTTRP